MLTFRRLFCLIPPVNDITAYFILKKLAAVNSGHSFPKRLEHKRSGSVAVLQMKDIPFSLQMKSADPIRLHSEDINPHYLLNYNDIIFRARGSNNTCSILKADFGASVAVATLTTIRVRSELLLPDYLAWWINQKSAQNHFNRHARGTSVRMITRETLETLELPLPPLEVQERIIELALLGEREQYLLSKLAKAQQKKLRSILTKAATEEK